MGRRLVAASRLEALASRGTRASLTALTALGALALGASPARAPR